AIFALTFDTPGKRPTSLDAMLWIMTFVCGGWAANASVKLTSPPWMATSRTSPSATMSFWLSGSLMPRSVSRTSCSLAIRTNDIPDGPGGPNGNAASQSEACSCARHPEARAQAVEKTLRLAWNADCCQMERRSRRELAPLRDDAPRQIRRRGAPPERPRRAADRGRAGAAQVPRGVQARRGRSHDSHRTG